MSASQELETNSLVVCHMIYTESVKIMFEPLCACASTVD